MEPAITLTNSHRSTNSFDSWQMERAQAVQRYRQEKLPEYALKFETQCLGITIPPVSRSWSLFMLYREIRGSSLRLLVEMKEEAGIGGIGLVDFQTAILFLTYVSKQERPYDFVYSKNMWIGKGVCWITVDLSQFQECQKIELMEKTPELYASEHIHSEQRIKSRNQLLMTITKDNSQSASHYTFAKKAGSDSEKASTMTMVAGGIIAIALPMLLASWWQLG